MKKLKASLKNSYKYRYLLEQLITKSIKLKYRKSYLGVLWSLIEPLMTMIVLSFIFGTLLGRGDEYYPVYVLSGRLLYSFFSSGTRASMKSVRSNAAMIKKVYVPKYMYPLAACTSSYIIFLISLIDLFLVVFALKMKITWYLLLSVVPILILYILTYGVGMILVTVNTFFRDVEYIWDVLMTLVMYSCAIFYSVEPFVGTEKYLIFRINPLYCLIKCFRECIYGQPMELDWLLYALVCSIVAYVVGTILFKKKQDDFIHHI